MMVDENGLPLERTQPDAPQSDNPDEDVPPDPADRPAPQRLDQQWIDQVLGRDRQHPAQQRPNP
jgi:penicillin-binding protein 1A